MTQSFVELIIGDVLIAPFAVYAGSALAIIVLLRPLLALFAFDRLFSHPPVAVLCLYIVIVAVLVVAI
jgi:hypothetical protein